MFFFFFLVFSVFHLSCFSYFPFSVFLISFSAFSCSIVSGPHLASKNRPAFCHKNKFTKQKLKNITFQLSSIFFFFQTHLYHKIYSFNFPSSAPLIYCPHIFLLTCICVTLNECTPTQIFHFCLICLRGLPSSCTMARMWPFIVGFAFSFRESATDC